MKLFLFYWTWLHVIILYIFCFAKFWPVFSNYWMRLSRIWRILQIKEAVIHRGWRPRWIIPSEICRILHILRNRNSIIALLCIQNIFRLLNEKLSSLFFCSQPFPRFSQSTVQWSATGCTFDVFGSIWQRFFSNLVKSSWLWWNTHVVLTNQKYFEWLIILFITCYLVGSFISWKPCITALDHHNGSQTNVLQ